MYISLISCVPIAIDNVQLDLATALSSLVVLLGAVITAVTPCVLFLCKLICILSGNLIVLLLLGKRKCNSSNKRSTAGKCNSHYK